MAEIWVVPIIVMQKITDSQKKIIINNTQHGIFYAVAKTGLSFKQILNFIGRSKTPVPKGYYKQAAVPKEDPVVKENTIEEDISASKEKIEYSQLKGVAKKYETLVAEVYKSRQMHEEIRDIIASSLKDKLVIHQQPAPKRSNSKSTEDAVLVLSDSHFGKIVDPAQTSGFGHYNPAIAVKRCQHIQSAVSRLITNNIDSPIQTLHIFLLGDLVEGMLNHAEECPDRLLVVDQVQLAALSFYQLILNLAAVIPNIKITGMVGNHGRWPNQKKMPTSDRYSNLDGVVIEWISSLISASGLKNVSCNLGTSIHEFVDIRGWRFCLSHGDHLKGGDKALGVPSHSIGREISAMTSRLASSGQKVPDYYIVGDKHRPIELPTATGKYIINGAWVGVDTYSMSGNFSPNRPQQLFFGVHDRYGKSWSYDIALDEHLLEDKIDYNYPPRIAKLLR